MKKEKDKENYETLLGGWIEFLLLLFFGFMVIITGVLLLPQVPEKARLFYSLGIMSGSVYFTLRMIDIIFLNLEKKNQNEKK